MIQYRFKKHILQFKTPAGTSRGILTYKPSWFVEATDTTNGRIGLGECSIIPGLSPEYINDEEYEKYLEKIVHGELIDLTALPSIRFGLESAELDLKNGGNQIYFNNSFSNGLRSLPINGLIWMGSKEFMKKQIDEKINQGFNTIKLKIGAISFDEELSLISYIRSKYSALDLTIRVDANGAFSAENSLKKLDALAQYNIHSIEQPIPAGQFDAMKTLCAQSPIPIALDEELIGVHSKESKIELLDTINPQYIILKPSLHGGITGTQEWISIAEDRGISWWMTSALESNVGLNTICQLAGEYENTLPQGLGTGGLYTNNTETSLVVQNGTISLKHD